MADENIGIEVTGFQSLKSQIKEAQIEYQKLLADVNSTPQAVQEAASRVADLKDRFDDANDAVNALTGAGKFQALGKGLTAISGGFTAVQGAIGLAGGNAKDFEKTIAKVQSAMALTQGLTALEDLGNAFGNMKKVAVNAFQSIKTAIGSTGIGLLVVALGAIYAYWDDIKAAVSGVSEEQEALNVEAAANLEIQKGNLDAIGAQEEILKLQGKSEEEIYQIKIDQYDATIKAAKVQLDNMEATKKAQVEAAQRNKDILQGIIRFITAPITILLKTIDEVGKALGQDFGLEESFSGGLAKLVFDPEETKKEADKTIKEAKDGLIKLENERAGLINKHNDKIKADREKAAADKKAADDKALADAKAANEKENQLQEAHLKNIQKLKDDAQVIDAATEAEKKRVALQNTQEAQAAELATLIKGYEDKKKLTKEEEESLKVLKEEQAAQNILFQKQQAELEAEIAKTAAAKKLEDLAIANTEERTALLDKYNQGLIDQKEYDRQLQEQALQAIQEEIDIRKAAGENVAALEEQLAQKKKEIRDQDTANAKEAAQKDFDIQQAKIQAVVDGLNILASATELFAGKNKESQKKAFQVQKALNIATATIQTYQAASAVLAQASLNPATVLFPGYPAIQAGLIIAAGLANVAKISAQKFDEGGSGGGEGEGGGAKPSTYADGGYVRGPGTGRSDSIPARLSDGEFVVNARSTAMYGGLLSLINQAGGGKGMADGGRVGPTDTQTTSFQLPIIKTYVVASDMTDQQEADAKIQRIAQLQ